MNASHDASFDPWIGFETLLRREVMRYLKLAAQTLGAPFLSNLLFLAVFGGAFSERSSGIEGISYVRFLTPGLILMGAVLSAFQNPLFSIVAMKYQNTLQDLRQYPLSASSLFFAFALAAVLRGLLVGAMTFAAAGLFAGFSSAHPLLYWPYVAATSFVAAAGGVAAGLYVESYEQANFIVSFTISPALFLGGVFFDPARSSSWLRFVVRYDPFTFFVGQGRRFYLGAGAPEPPVTAFLAIAVAVCALALAGRSVASGKGMKVE